MNMDRSSTASSSKTSKHTPVSASKARTFRIPRVRQIFGYLPRLQQYIYLKHGNYGIVMKHRHVIRQKFPHKIDHFWNRKPQWHFEALWHPKAAAVEHVACDFDNKGVPHGEMIALVKAWECLDTPGYDDVIEVFEDEVARPEELQADLEWMTWRQAEAKKEIAAWYKAQNHYDFQQFTIRELTVEEIRNPRLDRFVDIVSDVSDNEEDSDEDETEGNEEDKTAGSATVKKEEIAPDGQGKTRVHQIKTKTPRVSSPLATKRKIGMKQMNTPTSAPPRAASAYRIPTGKRRRRISESMPVEHELDDRGRPQKSRKSSREGAEESRETTPSHTSSETNSVSAVRNPSSLSNYRIDESRFKDPFNEKANSTASTAPKNIPIVSSQSSKQSVRSSGPDFAAGTSGVGGAGSVEQMAQNMKHENALIRFAERLDRMKDCIQDMIEELPQSRTRMRAFVQSRDAEGRRLAAEINRRFSVFCREGNLEELYKILRENGAECVELNDKDCQGMTLAHMVATQRCRTDQHEYCKIMMLLFNRGAKVTVRDWQLRSPLMKAVMSSNECMTKTLLDECLAPISTTDLKGQSVLSLACQLRRSEDVDERIVAALLAKGADVNQKCNSGKIPLELAGGSETRVGRLLELYTERLETAFRGKLRQILPRGWRLVRPIFPLHILALRDYEFDAFRMKFNRSEMDLREAKLDCRVEYRFPEKGPGQTIDFKCECSMGQPCPVQAVVMNGEQLKKVHSNGPYISYMNVTCEGMNELRIDIASDSLLGARGPNLIVQGFVVEKPSQSQSQPQ